MASYNGHRGGKGNLGKKKTAKQCANMHLSNKWNDNLESVKLFIAIEGRLPSSKAANDMERRLGAWIAHYKNSEGGTDSEHEQLLMREVLLAFIDHVDKWNEKLESLKSFISIVGILPSKKIADDEKRSLGH